MLEKTIPYLRGNLGDLFDLCPQKDQWRKNAVVKSLAGMSADHNLPFCIPAADTGAEVFFDDPEMLSRFANLPLPDQAAFLSSIRIAFTAGGVDEMRLTVAWSNDDDRRVLLIKNTGGNLDLYVRDISVYPSRPST